MGCNNLDDLVDSVRFQLLCYWGTSFKVITVGICCGRVVFCLTVKYCVAMRNEAYLCTPTHYECIWILAIWMYVNGNPGPNVGGS